MSSQSDGNLNLAASIAASRIDFALIALHHSEFHNQNRILCAQTNQGPTGQPENKTSFGQTSHQKQQAQHQKPQKETARFKNSNR
jgi:hypothetical protein